MRISFSLLLLVGLTFELSAREVRLSSPAELAATKLEAGDVAVLPEGEFADVNLSLKGINITLRAATPGKTVFTGASSLKFAGIGIKIQGLVFKDPASGVSEVIQFRTDSDELANECVLEDCAILADPPSQANHKESKWCSVYGQKNRLERCSFIGKANTLVVWLPEDGKSGGQHVISRCLFGERPKLGKNGGETIRIGDSDTSQQDAQCTVTESWFERCNGEGEIISNKSCGNTYSKNVFLECEGALTLRHGHRARVIGNMFDGNHKKLTGGVRIIGEDHLVEGNAMVNLEGEEYRSALTFMNAIPNTPANGYEQVKRAIVRKNTIMNCRTPFTIGMKHDKSCTLPPVDVQVIENTVYCPDSKLITLMSEAPEWKWQGNSFAAKDAGDPLPGVALSFTLPIAPLIPIGRSQTGARWAVTE
jgi:poly(beta-D-mannuronate) lyase